MIGVSSWSIPENYHVSEIANFSRIEARSSLDPHAIRSLQIGSIEKIHASTRSLATPNWDHDFWGIQSLYQPWRLFWEVRGMLAHRIGDRCIVVLRRGEVTLGVAVQCPQGEGGAFHSLKRCIFPGFWQIPKMFT